MNKADRKENTHRGNRPWLFFQVTVGGLPPLVTTAPDADRAFERAWARLGRYTSAASLEDFRKIATIKPCQQPVRDGYEGVRRKFKIDVRPGRRVRLQAPGMVAKGDGFVIYPEGTATMVHVVMDGTATPIRVAPTDIRAL